MQAASEAADDAVQAASQAAEGAERAAESAHQAAAAANLAAVNAEAATTMLQCALMSQIKGLTNGPADPRGSNEEPTNPWNRFQRQNANKGWSTGQDACRVLPCQEHEQNALSLKISTSREMREGESVR